VLSPGKTIGRFEIVEQIGSGGMGEVWKATDTSLGRSVALKALPDSVSDDPELLSRLEREARLLASLSHPNIAAIYGLERSGDVSVLELELIPGQTLSQRLQSGPVPVQSALEIALQIVNALEAAHKKGVIHRDRRWHR
jgi:serine/threonine protein kinase